MRWGIRSLCVLAVVVAAGAGTGVGAATGAAPSGTATEKIQLAQSCSPPSGQICRPLVPIGSLTSYSDLEVVFRLDAIHCSSVAVRLFVDGHLAVTTAFAPPGVSTERATVPWPKDGKPHTLGYQGQGKTGGCNGGNLITWSGSLSVTYTPAKELLVSGHVMGVGCPRYAGVRGCKITYHAASGAEVQASGPGGTASAVTGVDGSYSLAVRKPGTYTVRVVAQTRNQLNDPAQRDVNVTGPKLGVNFLLCKNVAGATNCDPVKVEGTTVDVRGAPFKLADVWGNGPVSSSGGSGHFVLTVLHGPQTIEADRTEKDHYFGTPTGQTQVDATHDVSGVVVTIKPTLYVHGLDAAGETTVWVAGLPLHSSFTLYTQPTDVSAHPGCERVRNFTTGALRTDEFDWTPSPGFCKRVFHFTAALIDTPGSPGATGQTLATAEFSDNYYQQR